MADNAQGFAAMQAQIERLRALPRRLIVESAPAIAEAAQKQIASNVAKNVGPDGQPWPESEDGSAVLTGAARAVNSRAVGGTILITVEGAEAKHHKGTAKGGKRRPVIPTRKIPTPLIEAIEKTLGNKFREIMNG